MRFQSFTKAADECFISQSAISQQIQTLENDLGVRLINRERRKFSLTRAGEFFYQKSLVLISDFDRLCAETMQLSKGFTHELKIGFLRHYAGKELKAALANFKILTKHPLSLEECMLFDYSEGFDKIDWDTLERVGTDDAYSRNVKMAECLSCQAIAPSLIQCVYVPDEWTKDFVEQLFWDKGITEQPPYVSVMEVFF